MHAGDSDFEELLSQARALVIANEDTGDLWEANDHVVQALAQRPTAPDAWLLKAQIMSALADPASSLACAEMALRRAGRSAEAHYWIAAAFADLERYQDALKAIERAFRYLANDDDALMEDLYYEKAMILRAAENAVWFASVNYAFARQESATSVVDPDGACADHLPYGEAGLLVHDLDLDRATGLYARRYDPSFYPG